MKIVIENAGAQNGFLSLKKEDKLFVVAQGNANKDEYIVLQSELNDTYQQLPLSLVNYVERTQENVVLNEAFIEGIFTNDPYIINRPLAKVLITRKGKRLKVKGKRKIQHLFPFPFSLFPTSARSLIID